MKKVLSTLLCAGFGTILAVSQVPLADFDLEGDLDAWYDQALGIKYHDLFEGVQVAIPTKSPFGHQFFGDANWAIGSIRFDGKDYSNIQMLYDLENDVVLVRNLNAQDPAGQSIKIQQAKIEEFQVHGEVFKKFDVPDEIPTKSGIYHALVEGPAVSVIVKRGKSTKVFDDGFNRGLQYYTRDRYFIKTDDVIIPFKGKGSFFGLFPEYKSELKTFAKSRRLNIKKDFDDDIRQFVGYCNEISGS